MIRSSLARILKLNRILKTDVQSVDRLGRPFTTSSDDRRNKDATKRAAAAVQAKIVAPGAAVPIPARKKSHVRDKKKRLKRSSPSDHQVCAAYSTTGDVNLKQLHLILMLKGIALVNSLPRERTRRAGLGPHAIWSFASRLFFRKVAKSMATNLQVVAFQAELDVKTATCLCSQAALWSSGTCHWVLDEKFSTKPVSCLETT